MALIKCPECGREISDKAEVCIGCGFPLKEYLSSERTKNDKICAYCGSKDLDGDGYCNDCGLKQPVPPKEKHFKAEDRGKEKELEEPEFEGIYRKTSRGFQEVYCPRCGSENCSYYQEQRFIPAKTKTRYTANLNPLRPFTLMNKKEKVIRKEELTTETKIKCNDCGYTFK